jgi:hypothetical protein
MTTFLYLPETLVAINLSQVARVNFAHNSGVTIEFTNDEQEITVTNPADLRALVDALGRLADDASGRAMRARTATKEREDGRMG